MGLSWWKKMVSHSFCRTGHTNALYVGCFGWQTAPGGGGWRSLPETVWFRVAHAEVDGQLDEPRVALHDSETDA